VNWYVFFKGWLIPSPPPTIKALNSSLISWHLKNFSIQSGLFPSWLVNLCANSPYCVPKTKVLDAIWNFTHQHNHLNFRDPFWNYALFYVNRFRGEPAITKFDKPFTPNHSSSQSFAYTHEFGLFNKHSIHLIYYNSQFSLDIATNYLTVIPAQKSSNNKLNENL